MTNQSEDTSIFVRHEPCPECGSKDNLSRYSDGHAYCFGCKYREPADDEKAKEYTNIKPRDFTPVHTEKGAIPNRGLTEETCRLWDYGYGELGDKPCHVANYRDAKTGELIGQKLRFTGKGFSVLKAGGKKLPLYGMHLWKNDRRSLVVTEGELDALSVSQAQGNKYPVVSVPNGAQGAILSFKENYEWLCEFDKIVIMFDGDEPGREAAEECAQILPAGKAFIASFDDFKDANEALVAGKPSAIVSAFWNAKPYCPDGIFTLSDIREDVMKEVATGKPWFLETLTKKTYGRRDGEVYYFGAGTGVGKTDFFTQQIAYDILELNIKTACIYLEQPPAETGKRIAGKVAGKLFHIPNDDTNQWDQEELEATFDKLEATGNLLLGGNFAAANWEQIKSRIRYLCHSLGVKHIFLDHLTALANPSNERESLEIITKELALLAQELEIVIHVISHLSTPDGKPHEEGGRVMLRHFKGSRAIGFWAHYAFGLERNPQDDDPKLAQRSLLRCLKDRYTGRATGATIPLGYNQLTGTIYECGEFDMVEESNLDV
ncbi:Archaeal primase DnaG/twinkle, TOPRIM domain [uncultured Caudovirales phage]|uniref:DNA helicase/primase n=1 Tax=uncultured Caudovirales phage TaxID=2100421 RepID=A0A6J5M0X1_9CAUD|nr:Archaeal primase DnaG/twinkle, TOPRIM domain [uncultured Caudovirales phage]